MWGKTPELLGRIDRARSQGIDVMADQYPYSASGSSITGSLIPRWAQAGGREAMVARIDAPDVRDRLLHEVRENLERRGGAQRLMIALYPPEMKYEGLRLSEVAGEMNRSPAVAALEMLREADASLVSFVMDDEDVTTIMRSVHVMVASDGRAAAVDEPLFPRVLGHYSRERGVLTLEQAVRKMTSMPAERLGLTGRGHLRPGAKADLVLFDPETVIDRATFERPKQYPEGIELVMVNGRVVIEDGRPTGVNAGKVLRRSP